MSQCWSTRKVWRWCAAASLCLLLAAEVTRGEQQDAPPVADDNPYRAAEGLSPDALMQYVARMLERPATVRVRPQFMAAVIDATDRIQAADIDELRAQAILAHLEVLHFAALSGDGEADRRLEALAPKYEQDPGDEVARAARLYILEYTALNADSDDKELLKQFLSDSEQLLAESEPGPQHRRLLTLVVKAARLIEDKTMVQTLTASMAKRLKKCNDRELVPLRKALAKLAEPESEQPATELVGKPLEIDGATIDGLDFDWQAYRGRVVLVDFWATWCGPCVREVPNIKQVYDQYHDQGFEVVGISMDRDRKALEKFLAEHNIPWVTLFEGPDQPNPVAQRYGVHAIPLPILVDREGNVVSTTARGEALGQLVGELLGTEQSL